MSLDRQLKELLLLVSPATLRLRGDRVADDSPFKDFVGDESFEAYVQTRNLREGFYGRSPAEAIRMALDGLSTESDVDPVIPSWFALSRSQRELVISTIRGKVAEHRGQAARRDLLGERGAESEHRCADAYEAALAELEVELPSEEFEPLRGKPTKELTEPVAAPTVNEKAQRRAAKKTSTKPSKRG